MTTKQIGDEFHTTMTVEKVAEVDGRDGPQWELTVRWPWTTRNILDRIWLSQGQFEDKPGIGSHGVFVRRASLKRNKDGPYSGEHDWMWNYRLIDHVGEDVDAEPASFTEPPTTPQDNHPERWQPPDDRETSIRMGQAANIATTLLTQFGVGFTGVPGTPDWVVELRYLRDKIYREVLSVGITPPHFCWAHNTPRIQSQKTGHWGHLLDDGTACVEETAAEPEEEMF